MRCKRLLFYISFLFCCKSFGQDSSFFRGGGTTVITLITNDTIWMGADSRHSIIKDNRTVAYKSILKINEHKKVFYALASEYATLDNEKNKRVFDAAETIKKAINKGGSFDVLVSNIGKFVADTLNKLYPKFPSGTKAVLQSKQGLKLFEIIIVCNIGEKLQYESVDIGLLKKNGKFEFASARLQLAKSSSPLVVIGYRREIYKYVSSPEYAWTAPSDKKELLIKLIGKEASVNPGVGGTVDAVAIFKNGRKWLTNNKY